MSTSTMVNSTIAGGIERVRYARWRTVLVWGIALALFVLAVGMRLYHLGLPFDRDGYDEGVYWQSLRAMSAGHTLYQQIFYSQFSLDLRSLVAHSGRDGSALHCYPCWACWVHSCWVKRLAAVLARSWHSY